MKNFFGNIKQKVMVVAALCMTLAIPAKALAAVVTGSPDHNWVSVITDDTFIDYINPSISDVFSGSRVVFGTYSSWNFWASANHDTGELKAYAWAFNTGGSAFARYADRMHISGPAGANSLDLVLNISGYHSTAPAGYMMAEIRVFDSSSGEIYEYFSNASSPYPAPPTQLTLTVPFSAGQTTLDFSAMLAAGANGYPGPAESNFAATASLEVILPAGYTAWTEVMKVGDLPVGNPIPLPTSLVLLGSGLLGLVGIRKRKT